MYCALGAHVAFPSYLSSFICGSGSQTVYCSTHNTSQGCRGDIYKTDIENKKGGRAVKI